MRPAPVPRCARSVSVRGRPDWLPGTARTSTGAGPPAARSIQVGSFASEPNARSLEQGLAGSIPDVEVVRRVVGGDTYFRNLSDA